MILTDYTGLILHEHKDKPNFVDVVSAPILALIEWTDELNTAVENIDIDNAEAPYLDIVGEWVGRLRASLPNQPVSDSLYQLILRAKIIANHWDGSTEQLYAIWDEIFQGSPQLMVQDIGVMRIIIGVLGASEDLAFTTIATPLCKTPIDYDVINHVILTSFFIIGGTPTPTLLFNSSSEPVPVVKTITGAATDARNLHVYVVFEPGNPDIFYNILSPEPWENISPTIPTVTVIEYALDVFVRDGTGYTFTMPEGWAVAEDWTAESIVWEDPPVINTTVSGWARLSNAEIYMLRNGRIIPKPSGVEIVDYMVLSEAGKFFGWDIENAYFAGWDEGLWAMEVSPSSSGTLFPWILELGLWNDNGEWQDYADWKDGP